MIDMLHITTRSDWEKAIEEGSYSADSLASQGFIHCSTPAQITAVANRYYRGQHGLVLLCIDAIQVQAEIRRENLEGGLDLFPHIYGPLNLDAVVRVDEIEPLENGAFEIEV
jgi:uncharacterized protein (DUF952 family)